MITKEIQARFGNSSRVASYILADKKNKVELGVCVNHANVSVNLDLMPISRHETEDQADAFARETLKSMAARAEACMTHQEAIQKIAGYVTAVRDDCDFSARAVWAESVLRDVKINFLVERIESIDFSSTDIVETRSGGSGQETLIIRFGVISLVDGAARELEFKKPNTYWENANRGEAVYV